MQHFRPQAELVEHVGTVVLDEYIGMSGQTQQRNATSRLSQVQGQRLLVTVVGIEIERRVPRIIHIRLGDERTDVVPRGWRLHLDYLCPHLGHPQRGKGSRPHHGEVNHSQPGQR